jgi:hypothetical protein
MKQKKKHAYRALIPKSADQTKFSIYGNWDIEMQTKVLWQTGKGPIESDGPFNVRYFTKSGQSKTIAAKKV